MNFLHAVEFMPLKRKTYKCSFQAELKLLCAFCILHLLTIVFDLAVPVVLLYGPVLYRLYLSLTAAPVISRQEYHLHQFPFYVMTVLGLSGLDVYHALYLPGMPLSLLAYGGFILMKKKKIADDVNIPELQLFKLLVMIALIISLPLLMFATQPFMKLDWGFSVRNLIYYILLLCVFMMGTYLFLRQRGSSSVIREKESPPDNKAVSMGETSEDGVHLIRVLEERQLYLDPLLSLEKFASEAGLPRHKCTKLIQEEHNKSFYQLIAEYRIKHSMQLLEQDILQELTIEGIAESCGFNSKASFNRYFKEISGCTPSAYRKKLREGSGVCC